MSFKEIMMGFAKPVTLHPVLFYFLMFFLIIFFLLLVYLLYIILKAYLGDMIILIDKSNRWHTTRIRLPVDADDITINNKKYLLIDDYGLLNRRGKALYIFSENKPQPMKLKYNDAQWINSESLMSVINNKLIKMLVEVTTPLKDMLILWGSIGGIIAGIASVIVLLKTFNVIK